jgi:hypothetical protein
MSRRPCRPISAPLVMVGVLAVGLGGGIAGAQDAKASGAGRENANATGFLERSKATGRILVFGTSDFATDEMLAGVVENGVLLQSAVRYMAEEPLASVRTAPTGSETRRELNDSTRRLLAGLSGEVRLTAYLTTNESPDAAASRKEIEELLRSFELTAKPHLRLEFVDPAKSEKAKAAAKAAGIQLINLATGSGQLRIERVFRGLVIEVGGKSETLGIISDVRGLESQLDGMISRLVRRGVSKVAWQKAAPAEPGRNDASSRTAAIPAHDPGRNMVKADELIRGEYATTTVDLASRVPDDVKVVVLCNADRLTGAQEFWLDQFLLRGGGVIAMVDGTLAKKSKERTDGDPLHREGNGGLASDIFEHYGFEVRKDVVLDLSCERVPYKSEILIYPPFVRVTRENVDSTHPITVELQHAVFPWTSSISLRPGAGVKALELVKSSAKSKSMAESLELEPGKLLPDTASEVEGWKAGFKNQYLLVGLLEGEFTSYFASHPIPSEIIAAHPEFAPAKDGVKPGSENRDP